MVPPRRAEIPHGFGNQIIKLLNIRLGFANCNRSPADVDVRPQLRIFFGLPQYFAGYRSSVALAEQMYLAR